MKINIAELIKTDSKRIALDEQYEGFLAEDGYRIVSPIQSTGTLWYESGMLKYRITVDYIAEAVCARCLDSFRTAVHFDTDDEIAREDIMEAYGNDMDTQLLVKDLIILNMPLRVLCSEECKGLCSKCGCNLNHQTCDCMTEQYSNSQFAALKDWQSKSGKE
ncbi:MAG: DUF177 domain-containing protein [Anaerofustis sp.]